MTRINYLIAACSHRVGKTGYLFPGQEVLRVHLRELAKTDTQNLTQITVLRTLPLVRTGDVANSNYYWDVDLTQFKCHVEVMDVTDYYFSYSSWVQAIARWRSTFDYYVLTEDDYYAAHPRFAEVLVEEHRRLLPDGGYLNGFTTDHAAVSTGMVDSRTFLKNLDALADPIDACKESQRGFGQVFCGNQLADWTDRYRCLYSIHRDVIEQVHDLSRACEEDVFRPVEYLITGEKSFERSCYPGSGRTDS